MAFNLSEYVANCVKLSFLDPDAAMGHLDTFIDLVKKRGRRFNEPGQELVSRAQNRIGLRVDLEDSLRLAVIEYQNHESLNFVEARTYLEIAENCAEKLSEDINTRVERIREVYENRA